MRRRLVFAALAAGLAAGSAGCGQTAPKLTVTKELVYTVPEGTKAYEPEGWGLEGKGTRWAFPCTRGNKWFVVLDGVELGPYDDVLFSVWGPQFSPDGRRFAYVAVAGDKELVVLDGTELTRYDRVREPQFSPDSKRFAYVATAAGKELVVLDGMELKPYDGVGLPEFSPDSKRFAYWARQGEKELIVLDGVEQEPLDEVHLLAPEPNAAFVWYAWSGKALKEEGGDVWWQPGTKLYRFTAR